MSPTCLLFIHSQYSQLHLSNSRICYYIFTVDFEVLQISKATNPYPDANCGASDRDRNILTLEPGLLKVVSISSSEYGGAKNPNSLPIRSDARKSIALRENLLNMILLSTAGINSKAAGDCGCDD